MQNLDVQQNKKVSVSVVFYNPAKEELHQTKYNIQKLMALNNFQFEFYLIDNGSPLRKIDEEIFNDIQDTVTIIKLEENCGFGKGHNTVLSKLSSQYHIVMNPDIRFNDLEGFQKAINYLDSHREAVLISPLVRDAKTGHIQYLNRKLPTVFDLLIRFMGPHVFPKRQKQFTKYSSGYDHIQIEENATGSFMLVRTQVFKQVHGFDPRFFMYFEDTDLSVRLAKEGKLIMFPSLTVYHGWRRANHSFKGMFPMLQSMAKYFNKWGWQWF
ncbi:glycosyltransferase [Lactobacillaceae bacterium 24-114]